MKEVYGNKGESISSDAKKKDYQPGESQFAGEMMGKTNQYMERKDKQMNKSAAQIRSQAHKGRYD